MRTKEQLDRIKHLLFLVNEYPELFKKSSGFCGFMEILRCKKIISERTQNSILNVLFLDTINPLKSKANRLGVWYSFFYKTSENGYFFTIGCVWRRKRWLNRLILKLEKYVK